MTPRGRTTGWLPTGVVMIVVLAATAAFAQDTRGIRQHMVERDVRVTHLPPEWLAMPEQGRLATAEGVDVRPLQNASVSYENASLGMLIGAFRNVGPCLRDVSVRMRYTDAQGAPIGAPIENEARVTTLDPDALLPYRFRLKKKMDLPRPAAGYLLEVTADGRPVAPGLRWVDGSKVVERRACPARPFAFEVTRGKSKAKWTSYHVAGTLRIVDGGPIRPDGITLTALLLDKDQQVLEVLTGAPDLEGVTLASGFVENGHVLPFTLATPVPLGKWVAEVQIFAELLSDAQVARDALK